MLWEMAHCIFLDYWKSTEFRICSQFNILSGKQAVCQQHSLAES